MSTFSLSSTRESDILEQIEIDNKKNENEIQFALTQVREKFDTFRKELNQSEKELITSIDKMKEDNYRNYLRKRKIVNDFIEARQRFDQDSLSSFDRKIVEIEQDLGLVIHYSLFWQRNHLNLENICEINKSQIRESPQSKQMPPSDALKELKQMLFDSRPVQNLQTSEKINFTDEMRSKARSIIQNNQQKYSILPIYQIITHNLEAGKSISDIRQGISFLSKYPVCLLMDPVRKMFHSIQVGSPYFKNYVKAKLEKFEVVFERMEFEYQPPHCEMYQINLNSINNPKYIDKIAAICSELLLAMEELISCEGYSRKGDALSYFTRKFQSEFQSANTSTSYLNIHSISPQEDILPIRSRNSSLSPPDNDCFTQSQKVDGEKYYPRTLERQNTFEQSYQLIPEYDQFNPNAFQCDDNFQLYSLNERVNSPPTSRFSFSAFRNDSRDLYPGTEKDS